MITFNYETDFILDEEIIISNWVTKVIVSEGFKEGEITYVFCNDDYLNKLNVEFLKHDTLTDIISFDYCMGKVIQGDIFISIERVMENAIDFDNSFDTELRRVIIHGILHYCGYNDKTSIEQSVMREKENYYLSEL
ncbi:UNVERIFIED_CONTAM: hypothetical protein GTU68_042376 [Idotea baltica]|nr:hypothetical protein [Idotea baltica]